MTRSAAGVAAAVVLAATGAGCGSAGVSHGVVASPYPRPQASDVAAIRQAWQRVFDGLLPVRVRARDLVDRRSGQALLEVLATRGPRPLRATVAHVTLSDADHAIVTFTLYRGAAPVLADQMGLAVRRGLRWKVSLAAVCVVTALETPSAPGCHVAGASAAGG
jgi:hypothetical protein